MSQHARPHLETHSRGAGHSAIAGVAYRLGLRLYDRRTKLWHDYRRRKIGEEIVRALTVAPEDAPAWATDPEELWSRVEAAEKRKDAQVARDYRIPIPFGLSDQQAGDLAEDMARFICRELHTAVSLGLHRDGEEDALGNVKPPEKQGFHAHIYFPTRRLEEIQQDDGTSAWGLGAKLILLSNKNTSGAFVERLNEHWAELANRYTAANNLLADYDHRSYVRQDLPFTPQPTLGAAVTAMERRGFFTRRGDALRGDILIPATVNEIAQAIVLDAQRQRAQEYVSRERASQAVDCAVLSARVLAPDREEPAEPCGVLPFRSSDGSKAVADQASSTAAPILVLPSDLSRPALGSLLARFLDVVPAPTEVERFTVYVQVLRLIRKIEGALVQLVELGRRLRELREDRRAGGLAKFQTDRQLDELRTRRATARKRLDAWAERHPWKMRAATLAAGKDGRPDQWVKLKEEAGTLHRHVQDLKQAGLRQQADLAMLDQEGRGLDEQISEHQRSVDAAMSEILAADLGWAKMLVATTAPEERQWVEVVTPPVSSVIEAPAVDVMQAAERMEIAMRPPARRMRP